MGHACESETGVPFFNLNSGSFCHLDDMNNLVQLSTNDMHNTPVNMHVDLSKDDVNLSK